MRLIELVLLIVVSLCCTGGVGWLLYDMHKQLKMYSQAHEESTLGLVEDEEEDKK